MTEFASTTIDACHRVNAFDCGVPSLNDWLVNQAVRAKKSGTANTNVWCPSGSDDVVAYYAITPHQVRRDKVSNGLAGGVSAIPAYLLARLALDRSTQGRSLGGELLRDALERVVEAATVASGRLLVVDAIDDHSAKFYRKHDFTPVRDNPRRLVIKIATVRSALFG